VRPVIVVTGLRREAAFLHDPGIIIVAGGGEPARLASELAHAAARADGMISFGMAGALDPGLRLGDWVVADRIIGAIEATCDAQWVKALIAKLPDAHVGTCFADGQMILDPVRKQTLGRDSAALAIDMESHVAADVAVRAGLPLAVLRCISDEANAAIPPAIEVAMGRGGGLALRSVFASVLARPGQVPELARTMFRFSHAYAALRRGARTVGPRLAFDLR
jgi:adenosylhomocysteine nucleosidase